MRDFLALAFLALILTVGISFVSIEMPTTAHATCSSSGC
jgi:hypothetical protein